MSFFGETSELGAGKKGMNIKSNRPSSLNRIVWTGNPIFASIFKQKKINFVNKIKQKKNLRKGAEHLECIRKTILSQSQQS